MAQQKPLHKQNNVTHPKMILASIHLLVGNGLVQGAKKVGFTACHLGNLLLVCTTKPKSLLSSPQKILMCSIDYGSSVI